MMADFFAGRNWLFLYRIFFKFFDFKMRENVKNNIYTILQLEILTLN